MFICFYVYMFKCLYVCMFICLYFNMFLCLNVSMFVCLYVCMFICLYVYMLICFYVYMIKCLCCDGFKDTKIIRMLSIMREYRLLIDNKQILLVTIYKADFLESFLIMIHISFYL